MLVLRIRDRPIQRRLVKKVRIMKRKRLCLQGLAVLVCLYAAAPYVAVARLYVAVRAGDTDTIAALIDWESLRSGLKQDIAEGVIGVAAPQFIASNGLPPFGASFVMGIANNFVDREVTAEHLAVAAQTMEFETSATDAASSQVMAGWNCVQWAFFDSLSQFTILVHAPGQDAAEPPMRLRLELQGLSWKIVRAWIPQDLVDRVHFRT
jgi:hypothetical protein